LGAENPAIHTQSAESSLNCGGGHDLHTFDMGATAVEYWPAIQFVQMLLPGFTLYLPASKHKDADVTPEPVEYLPDTQVLHGALPGDILNLPALHLLQLPPSKPVELALQVHARRAVLFAGEEESA